MKAYCFSHDLFYSNPTTLKELHMPSSTPYIIPSSTFANSFVVIHPDGRQVACHNFSTAQVEAGLINSNNKEASNEKQISVEEYYGCVLGGFGRHTPAVTWTITGRVERCHNWATAQTIVRDSEKLRASLS